MSIPLGDFVQVSYNLSQLHRILTVRKGTPHALHVVDGLSVGWKIRSLHCSPLSLIRKFLPFPVRSFPMHYQTQHIVYSTTEITNSVEKLASLMKSHAILFILKHISLPMNSHWWFCLPTTCCESCCVSPHMNEHVYNSESVTHHPSPFSFFCLILHISKSF